jgi:two-component system response regulator AtoC
MDKILIVDDELNMRLVLKTLLKKEGYDVITASEGIEALKVLKGGDIKVVVTDLKMPKLGGMGLLDRVLQDYPSMPVILITAHGTVATAVDALKKGAFDYITKPFEQDELKNVVRKAIRTRQLNEDEPIFSPDEIDMQGIVGSSEAMQKVYEALKKVAPTMTTVLVTGETGTGKELIADAIHRSSPRKHNPLIKINCAAIADNLLESELFGYEKGAFTGAVSAKPGRFELADKGTLFLDEVGELPKDMQVKLLRMIQENEFERVGGLRTIKVDVRLIAATNRNLLQDVKDGKFREDLYYRLNVFHTHVPPLRERKEDVLPLADYFIQKFNKKLNRQVKSIAPDVQEIFIKYPWPGNIRELENLIERLVLMAGGDTITNENIPPEVTIPLPQLSQSDIQETPFKDLMKSHMEELEKQAILQSLEECGGNVTKAAQRLGVSRKGLQLKMIKYHLRK